MVDNIAALQRSFETAWAPAVELAFDEELGRKMSETEQRKRFVTLQKVFNKFDASHVDFGQLGLKVDETAKARVVAKAKDLGVVFPENFTRAPTADPTNVNYVRAANVAAGSGAGPQSISTTAATSHDTQALGLQEKVKNKAKDLKRKGQAAEPAPPQEPPKPWISPETLAHIEHRAADDSPLRQLLVPGLQLTKADRNAIIAKDADTAFEAGLLAKDDVFLRNPAFASHKAVFKAKAEGLTAKGMKTKPSDLMEQRRQQLIDDMRADTVAAQKAQGVSPPGAKPVGNAPQNPTTPPGAKTPQDAVPPATKPATPPDAGSAAVVSAAPPLGSNPPNSEQRKELLTRLAFVPEGSPVKKITATTSEEEMAKLFAADPQVGFNVALTMEGTPLLRHPAFAAELAAFEREGSARKLTFDANVRAVRAGMFDGNDPTPMLRALDDAARVNPHVAAVHDEMKQALLSQDPKDRKALRDKTEKHLAQNLAESRDTNQIDPDIDKIMKTKGLAAAVAAAKQRVLKDPSIPLELQSTLTNLTGGRVTSYFETERLHMEIMSLIDSNLPIEMVIMLVMMKLHDLAERQLRDKMREQAAAAAMQRAREKMTLSHAEQVKVNGILSELKMLPGTPEWLKASEALREQAKQMRPLSAEEEAKVKAKVAEGKIDETTLAGQAERKKIEAEIKAARVLTPEEEAALEVRINNLKATRGSNEWLDAQAKAEQDVKNDRAAAIDRLAGSFALNKSDEVFTAEVQALQNKMKQMWDILNAVMRTIQDMVATPTRNIR